MNAPEFEITGKLTDYGQWLFNEIFDTTPKPFFTAPIDLEPNDTVWVDMGTGQPLQIERKGVVIWRLEQ